MRPRRAVARAGAIVAAAVVPGLAEAQGPVVAGEAQQRIVVGGGLDGFLRDGSESTPQIALHLGYELRGGREHAGGSRVGSVLSRLGPRVGGRLGLDYTGRRYGPTVLRINGVPADTLDRSGNVRIFGAVLLGTYALARGPVRPYLLGGAGVYGLTSVRREPAYPGVPGVPELRATPGGIQRLHRVSPALSGGLGLSAPVRRVALFGEARATYLSNGVGGSAPGIRGVVIPLLVGVRF